jgi:membrane fusion protein (multidrug efflux system)
MGRRWIWIGLGLTVLGCAAAAVYVGTAGVGVAQARKDSAGKTGSESAVPLEFTAREVVQPAMAVMPLAIEFSGPLVAPQTAVVRAKAAGTLLALNVAEGGRVKAGQSIGQIDLADLASRVAERSAMLESALARLGQAERAHASNQRLADQQFISPIALETSRSELEAAQAQWRAAQAQLDSSRLGLREAALVAPISGVVQKRHALPGEKLSVEQPVLTIVDLARLELAGSVGTHEVSRLTPGLPVKLRVEGSADDVTGRVTRIAPAADPGTRSIGVTIDFENPSEVYRAGQYALARVVLADTTQRLTLPSAAIVSDAGQDHVWVIEAGRDGSRLSRKAVTTGRRDASTGRVEVLQGLQPGASVLAARFDNLREGAKATLVAGAAPVASASASLAVNAR